MTLIYFVLIFYFPESPSFLITQNKIHVSNRRMLNQLVNDSFNSFVCVYWRQEADKSIRFYQNLKGKSGDYEILQSELEKLKNAVGSSADSNGSTSICSNLTSGPALKALTIGTVLAALTQFSGCFAMLNYTASIFKEAGSTLSPSMSTIIIGIIQLLGSFAPTILIERAGRKVIIAHK